MSVSWPHVRLYVFTLSYYPWLLFGQCLVCVTRLLSKITETVLFFPLHACVMGDLHGSIGNLYLQ